MKTYGTVKFSKGVWILEAEPHVALRLKRVFPKVSKRAHGAIRITDSPETAREIEWFLSRYPLDCIDGAAAHMAEQAAKHRDQESLVADLLAGRRPPRSFNLALPMRDYQAVAVEMLLAQGGLLVGDEVGLGKSLIGIGVDTQAPALPGLVVTLTHLTRQWRDEFKKFAPGIRTHILKKGTPYDLGQSRRAPKGQMMLTSELPDVIICNYHKLPGWGDTLGKLVRSVVFDEVAELRHGEKTQKGAAAFHIAKSCAYRLGLSATPIFGLGSEIYPITEVLRPGSLGSREEFLEEWCGATDSRGNARIKDPAAFGTWMRDAGLMIRRTRKDVARELPPVTQSIQHVDADPERLTEIDNPAEELARIILAESELARGDKFNASGKLEGLVRQATGLAKAPSVAEFARMVLESEEKLVIFCWHRAVYDVLQSRLSEFAPVLYTGSETANQKDANKQAFIEGNSRILLMSLRAGMGLNGLQDVCRTCMFAELDWAPAVHHQSIGRLSRDGQKDPVIAYFMVTDCGSDPIIAEVLGIKKIQSQGIVDPKGEILESVDASGEHGRLLAQLYLKGAAA